MKGRKPIPTHLKILRGNPGKRKLNDDEPELPAPKSAGDEFEPPRKLTGAALKEWKRLAKELVESGVLTVGDMMPFWTYCWLVGQVDAFEKRIRRVGPTEAQKLGYHNAMLKYLDRMMRAAADLGLNPSARSRVRKVKTSSVPKSKKSEYFGDSHEAAEA